MFFKNPTRDVAFFSSLITFSNFLDRFSESRFRRLLAPAKFWIPSWCCRFSSLIRNFKNLNILWENIDSLREYALPGARSRRKCFHLHFYCFYYCWWKKLKFWHFLKKNHLKNAEKLLKSLVAEMSGCWKVWLLKSLVAEKSGCWKVVAETSVAEKSVAEQSVTRTGECSRSACGTDNDCHDSRWQNMSRTWLRMIQFFVSSVSNQTTRKTMKKNKIRSIRPHSLNPKNGFSLCEVIIWSAGG